MVSRLGIALLGLALAASPDAALRDEAALTRQCREAVGTLWPHWRVPPVSPEVRDWAASRGEDPTVAYGDFDDDGRMDVALLLQTTSPPGALKIVVCLSSLGVSRPVVVERPYCSEGITRVSKGQRYHDFATDREGIYPRDGVHAYCFEKAGATYLFTDGSFRQIVDSD
jgi:hypothetical protein